MPPRTTSPRKTIAVVFGGRSPEHDVSIITAHIPIIQALLASELYDVWPIYITKDGRWYADPVFNDLNYFREPDYEHKLQALTTVELSLSNGLSLTWPKKGKKPIHIDVVFPAMHGPDGEDGALMGVLRMADVPFVGCDVSASAVAMDKILTKQVLSAEQIPVVPYVWATKADWEQQADSLNQRAAALGWPLFVKPPHLGSSIGISRVTTPAALVQAIEVAFHYDDKVLIEQAVEPLTEVTLPMIGNESIRLGGIERPLTSGAFLSYDQKYLSGGKKASGVNTAMGEIPAKLSDDIRRQVEEYGRRTYAALGCAGIARVDFLIDERQHRVYVNEVNTLPGSLYHHNWRRVGVSNLELVTTLIDLAEARWRERRRLTRTFTSDILRHVSGSKNQVA